MKTVLLLRSGADGDYTFEGWTAYSISPIQKSLINLDLLEIELNNDTYAGIILTSRTAVEAVKAMRTDIVVPIFVVGEATGRVVRSSINHGVIVGEKSGDAVRLAPQIIDHFQNRKDVRLLHPGASKMIGGLSEKLADSGIISNHLPVYETTSRPEEQLSQDLDNLTKIDAVVFFSPSGVKSAQHLVRQRWPSASEIAIGISTAKSLDNCLICKDPNAKGNIFYPSYETNEYFRRCCLSQSTLTCSSVLQHKSALFNKVLTFVSV